MAKNEKLWGGRFAKKTDPLLEQFSKSIHYDYKLALYDLLGSIAHVEILKRAGFLSGDEAGKLDRALHELYTQVEEKKFKFDPASEDIHTNIQNELLKEAGDVALKLHTARSRNDQVVFATKLYCKVNISQLKILIMDLIAKTSELAKDNASVILPGFTHMQHAQPVLLQDYLGAYAEMLLRDLYRLDYIAENIAVTLGSGALAGTPIDTEKYSFKVSEYLKGTKLGQSFHIQAPTNSIDSVSDRDFVIEALSALSIMAMHLSRLSEDFILWSTKEFNFIQLDDAFCTGSSLMPQKKNPDALELIRGNTGRVYGNLVSVLTTMKGLPLSYNRDMQLDKEPLFNSFEILADELAILSKLMRTVTFNEKTIAGHLADESLYATDIVYYLVEKKIPFTDAHTIVGKLIRHSIENSIQIKHMPQSLLKSFSPKLIKEEIEKLFDPKVSIKSKRSVQRGSNLKK